MNNRANALEVRRIVGNPDRKKNSSQNNNTKRYSYFDKTKSCKKIRPNTL